MTTKKSKKANLEKKKTLFFQIGLILSLAVVFLAFEWKTYDKINEEWNNSVVVSFEEDLVDITVQEPKPKPKPKITTIIDIVDNNKQDSSLFVDVGDNQKTKQKDPVITKKRVEPKVTETEIFTVVEESPSFPGGEESLYYFLADNMAYPQMARESGIQGTVYVTFVVEPDGNITNVRILRDIGGGCGEEALRVIEKMPKWLPGKQRGKAVRVQFNLPVKFTLQG